MHFLIKFIFGWLSLVHALRCVVSLQGWKSRWPYHGHAIWHACSWVMGGWWCDDGWIFLFLSSYPPYWGIMVNSDSKVSFDNMNTATKSTKIFIAQGHFCGGGRWKWKLHVNKHAWHCCSLMSVCSHFLPRGGWKFNCTFSFLLIIIVVHRGGNMGWI